MSGPIVPAPHIGALLSLAAALAAAPVLAQVPTKCFEIESILVDACIDQDACPGSQEGQNEMVRFRVGPDPIALADIAFDWPNNTWRGLVQDATTASLTATLNSSIEGCGQLLEPPGGVIPPGSAVLLVTSTQMCTAANSFANLGDTLYIVFQAPGNSAGHFANHNNGPDQSPTPVGASSLRTTIMTHLPTNCGDTATYDRAQLVNVLGTYGGLSPENDGATARFSWPGIPEVTYVNLGCQAPFVPVEVEVAVLGALCEGGAVELLATLSGVVGSVAWSGGSGSFSDPTAEATTYTAGPEDVGEVQLTACAIGDCGDPVCTTVTVPIEALPQVSITAGGPLTLCPGDVVQLTASGADAFFWSTGASGAVLEVSAPGTYTVAGSTACGTAEASITVTEAEGPAVVIEGASIVCAGQEAELTATGADSYVWSTGATGATITVSDPGTYSVEGTNACGTATATFEVTVLDVQAAFEAAPAQGTAPLTVVFNNQSLPATGSFAWDFGDGSGSTEEAPAHVFTEPGVYNVTLTVTEGPCSASATGVVVVEEPEPVGESSVRVPNVFSPNGDGVNDVFQVEAVNLARMEVQVLNRWGQQVYLLERPGSTWNGRSGAGEALPDGTYFYVLTATGLDGRAYTLTGTVTLLR